jgi:hypothetical protein
MAVQIEDLGDLDALIRDHPVGRVGAQPTHVMAPDGRGKLGPALGVGAHFAAKLTAPGAQRDQDRTGAVDHLTMLLLVKGGRRGRVAGHGVSGKRDHRREEKGGEDGRAPS